MKAIYAITLPLFFVTSLVNAGSLIYQPINPSFGGDPFVGSYLLGKAQAQDTTTDPDMPSYEPLSASERLVQTLQSRLVSDLISDVSTGEVDQGSFNSDEFSVVISEVGGQLSISVTDKLTGDVTNIGVGGLGDF